MYINGLLMTSISSSTRVIRAYTLITSGSPPCREEYRRRNTPMIAVKRVQSMKLPS
jgi:hypothetical protein